jgi:ankyrin repeat protein
MIFLAAKSGNLQFMQAVLSQGGNLHATTRQKDTPLHFAAGSGNADVVKLLIQNGNL